MNKVICDVCGTDYPETATQCPICGCVRAGGAQTSAGNDVEKAASGYTYVKGGRFSKANVRKRLKATQAQQAAQLQAERRRDEADDDELEDEEVGTSSNKGLIVIVIVLLLAIIAVSSYIAITFFSGSVWGKDKDKGYTSPDTTKPSTSQTVPTSDPDMIPCTSLELHDTEIKLTGADKVWDLFYEVKPMDTTDIISFSSSDETVATVDANGRVTAVGEGEATIMVRCGTFEVSCNVVCQWEQQVTDPTEPTETEPTHTEPTEPDDTESILELNRQDFTLDSATQSWQLYKDGPIDRTKITWSSDDESVATVTDGLVEPVGNGRTRIRAKYEDQEATCWVTVKNIAQPTQPTDPEPTDPEPTEPGPTETEPTEPEPTEPVVEHELLINGVVPSYQYEGREDSADISLTASDDANVNQCSISISGAENVQWSNDDEAVCSVDADGRVTAKAAGDARLTATVDGVEYLVYVRVTAP